MARIRHQFKLDQVLSTRLDELAARPGATKSAIIADAVDAWLNRRGSSELDDRFGYRMDRLTTTLGRIERNTHTVPIAPAQAIVVFDPSNYSQNVLTAARTLSQINNQIRSLQNQAQSLVNQARNLTTIRFPELQAITQTLQQIDRLMGQAQGIQFRVANLDQQFRSLFPTNFNAALTNNQHVVDARARLDTSMAAYKQTMTVQAQVVENIAADETTLNGIVSRSQGAEGGLQAQQATNQLLALVAKQQFQIENLMAAQYRADTIERANRAQAQTDAQSASTKFLGSGSAYTPQ